MKPSIQHALFLAATLLNSISALAAEPSVEQKDLPRVLPTEPSKALSTFQVKPGFKLDLVAAEPLVVSPVAMSFDENGRLFVVEMIDYSERRDERLGRIRVLEDTDGDGHFDKSTVFAKDLPWPTAVICYDGGVFVGATPDIYFLKDTNGDGVADVREVVFSGFGNGVERLNVQALLNSFNWGLDNRIHGATSLNGGRITSAKNPQMKSVELRGRDFSFDPRTLDFRAETGGGQHGLSFDEYGRKFVCSNSAHIQMLMYDDPDSGRNPFYSMPNPLVNIAEDGPAAPVFRISPDEPWRVIRTKWRVAGLVPGPVEGGGRPSGYFTGATGVTIYRGNAWPRQYRGNAFVADCGSNLIHRKELFPDGASYVARRAKDEQTSEFVASQDNWFRPVQFANAPDGTLYVVDMYREVIEHPWSLPQSIKQYLDLNSGNDRGRIYRIVPDGFKQPASPRLGSASVSELIATLSHENGWHRDTAARLLYQKQDRSMIPALVKTLESSPAPLGRLYALYALKSLEALNEKLLLRALADSDQGIREHAIRLCQGLIGNQGKVSEGLWAQLSSMDRDASPRVRYQLAFLMNGIQRPERIAVLSRIAARDCSDVWIGAAVLNSLRDNASFSFLESTISHTGDGAGLRIGNHNDVAFEFFQQVIRLIAARQRKEDISRAASFLGQLTNRNDSLLLTRSLLDGLRSSGSKIGDLEPDAQRQLKTIQAYAVDTVQKENAPEDQRIIALQLLGSMDWRDAGATLSAAFSVRQLPRVQAAAISALARFKEPEAGRAMLKIWPQMTPRSRSEVLGALLSRPQQIQALLDAIESNLVQRSDLSRNQMELLRGHRDPGVRQRAGKILPPKEQGDREKVVQQFQRALELPGRGANGHKIYLERCVSCHRVGKEGYAVGPDLASVKSNGKEKLLVSILDPNRDVAPNYLNYLIEMNDGESLSGLIATENATSLTLRGAFGLETPVLRTNIRRIQSLNQSVMPEGLESSLAPQDIADLLEFIVSDEANR